MFLFCCLIAAICEVSIAAEGSLRLVNGAGPHEGRVEVYRSGEWVTVCDDTWDIKDAAVVCRQLGYPTALVAVPSAGFGEGTTNNIWLDDIGCTGSELNLTDCSSSTYGWSRGCTHDEDAGVVCSATPAADDCLTFRTLVEETYQSGKSSYDSPYDWLEYSGSGVYIPQCLQDGSYATVQCSNTSLPVEASYSSYRARYCWCVDPATGIPTSTDYGAEVEPSPDDCPYYDTATLCQDGGDRYYVETSYTYCYNFGLQCRRGVLQPTPVPLSCAVPDCGPYVTPVYDDACGCGRCPPVPPPVAETTSVHSAQYIPLAVGLTALVIVLAIIGAGLGGICCVYKCWHPEKKITTRTMASP